MISLQYIAIVRLNPHVFWLPQEKKKKTTALKSCVVFMHETCVSFGLNSDCNLPGAQLHISSVNILGLQDTVCGLVRAISIRHPTARVNQPVHVFL